MIVRPKVVYAKGYDISLAGIEQLHVFDGKKYSRAWEEVRKSFGEDVSKFTLEPDRLPTSRELSLVHTDLYLSQLNSRRVLAAALEFPLLLFVPLLLIKQHVIKPMLLATYGTIVALEQSISNGLVFNLSGGYHHASHNQGQGFCLYSDIAIAIEKLRNEIGINDDSQAIIIDLDAHQGNGYQRIYHEARHVYIFDMYNSNIYPNDKWAKKRIDYPVEVPSGYDDKKYLGTLYEHLPKAFDSAKNPKIVIYIAGTDVYLEDKLGKMSVTEHGVLVRDQFVIDSCVEREIPCVVLSGGGYSRYSHKLISNTVKHFLKKY